MLGSKIEQFDTYVCNSFRPKILNNQLCYELDLNERIEKPFKAKDLELGLTLLIDENDDRQYKLWKNKTFNSMIKTSISKIVKSFNRVGLVSDD